MNDAFVIDSSIALAWVHPSQATAATNDLLEGVAGGATVYVPILWHLEVGNALLVAVRRKLMTHAQRESAFSLLSKLNVFVDAESPSLAWTDISRLAVEHSLSVYDASYLELAVRKKLPLASRDEPLRRAARDSNVGVL